MGTSEPLMVTDLSGNTLIETLPPRLIERVMARRAASSWREVIQPNSNVFKPRLPKAREIFRVAACSPRERPLWSFRYLTFLGMRSEEHTSELQSQFHLL